MRYKKILLLNPAYSGKRVMAVFPTGLGYIAEVLQEGGFDYDIIDMSLRHTYGQVKKRIEYFRPDLVGVSMLSYKYKDTFAVIRAIKRDFPDIHIVAGNAHVSTLREEALSDCPQIDYGVVLEGEQTILELCKGNPLDEIQGLIWRKDGRIIYNADRPFINDLDSINFPRYKKFELDGYLIKDVSAMPLVSSRGCPFKCIYCPVAAAIGRAFRVRSPGSVLEELAYWYEKGYRRFQFVDDNFSLVKERVYKICDLIKQSNMRDLKLSCDNGVRADMVDRDLLGVMREAGFERLTFGVEAGNNRILGNIKKAEKIETIERAILDACDLGYEINLFFLVGSPGEGWEDLQDSFRIASRHRIGMAFFYNLIPFPNTELFDWVKAHGRFIRDPKDYLHDIPVLDNDPVFETTDVPLKMRKRMLRYAFAFMRKTLRRNARKRLSHLGVLGKFFAFVYSTKFTQDVLLRNAFLNNIIYKVARICFD